MSSLLSINHLHHLRNINNYSLKLIRTLITNKHVEVKNETKIISSSCNISAIFNTAPVLKRPYSSQNQSFLSLNKHNEVSVGCKNYKIDEMTNVTPKIISRLDDKLHLTPRHPLHHLKLRIIKFMHSRYTGNRGNALFSVFDNLSPVVTPEQNFDQLLVPKDHVCRNKRDNYYINSNYLLRAHTSAHQLDLLQSGLDNFLIVGDVYRRDEIDSTHFPVFHQMEGVKLYTSNKLYAASTEPVSIDSILTGAPSTGACDPDNNSKQEAHTEMAVKILMFDLQICLQEMAKMLFGEDMQCRWVPAYFPFTQPSWELEVMFDGKWTEMLGCGIIQQKILERAGVQGKIGWAFGLGLERLAMKMYDIPDIRLFWSKDSGFLNQFDFEDSSQNVTYKPISVFPQCSNDISFWLPKDRGFDNSDFYDIVRQIGGDIVEQVKLFDEFTHPKNGLTSHAYRITYRHMEKTLTQKEVTVLHKEIEDTVIKNCGVKIR